MKVKATKVSPGASNGVFAKIYTRENFLLYGISVMRTIGIAAPSKQ